MALTDRAIGKIKEMIQSGELSPGDRLPPEQVLSERLGLSRSSLREAVKALEAIRVLDVRRGDGTYVTSLEPRLLLEAMSFVLDFHQSSAVLEVFAVRRILETASAAQAAASATPEDIARLQAALDTVDGTTDVEYLVEHDRQFHGLIAAATGNDYLASLIETVANQTLRPRIWRGLTQANAIERTLAEHAAILAAIAAGDSDLARSHMHAHIAGVEQWLEANLADDEPLTALDDDTARTR